MKTQEWTWLQFVRLVGSCHTNKLNFRDCCRYCRCSMRQQNTARKERIVIVEMQECLTTLMLVQIDPQSYDLPRFSSIVGSALVGNKRENMVKRRTKENMMKLKMNVMINEACSKIKRCVFSALLLSSHRRSVTDNAPNCEAAVTRHKYKS